MTPPQPVQVKGCSDITLRGNHLTSPDVDIPPAIGTGSPLLNADGASANILINP